jgi:hypothetical protein
MIHALLDALYQLPVEEREGIDLLRSFNHELKVALSGEKRSLLNLQRLAKANNYLYVSLGKDLQKIPAAAGEKIKLIDEAQACIRKAKARIGKMIRLYLGQKSKVVTNVGAELVKILCKNSFPDKDAMQWAFKLMRAYDPDRVGNDFPSFSRNVRRRIPSQKSS